jgi:hypothetical protein
LDFNEYDEDATFLEAFLRVPTPGLPNSDAAPQ